MKKVIMTVLVVGLFVAAVAVAPAWSQSRKAAFSLNLGVQTNIYSGSSFDNAWFTLDARVGIPVGGSFEISPELMYAVDDSFDFSFGSLYPGVLANYRAGNFFVGAGVVLPFFYGDGSSDTGNLAPKINVGYDVGKIKLTAYFIVFTESDISFLDMNQAGITVGFKF
jgi:hypothetical protein